MRAALRVRVVLVVGVLGLAAPSAAQWRTRARSRAETGSRADAYDRRVREVRGGRWRMPERERDHDAVQLL